ncbi:MAG TPA: type IX secretion system sortase PorU [Bacteroidia bacterium]|nr:type IX secretion system sortase PorU [Bacteroidia bacterium]HNU33920.1 type IX secretion system sortase PorU [Bacteroidia bacterium]
MKYRTKIIFVAALATLLQTTAGAQSLNAENAYSVLWKGSNVASANKLSAKVLGSKPTLNEMGVPVITISLPVQEEGFEYKSILKNISASTFAKTDFEIDFSSVPTNDFTTKTTISYNRKKPELFIEVACLRNVGGTLQKLNSFEIDIEKTGVTVPQVNRVYAANSVLKDGTWFKIGVTKDGIYKITYDFLKNKLGIDAASTNPANIRLFGNGGGMVPFLNSIDRKDDLTENAIEVSDNGTVGVLDNQDYVLFYGQSPDRWNLNASNNKFYHQKHLYSDTTYYFLSVDFNDGTSPKRIQSVNSSSATPNVTVTSFNDYAFHEEDLRNFIKSGREFYGEVFDLNLTQPFSFYFPNLTTDTALVRTSFATRSPGIRSYTKYFCNNNLLYTDSIQTGTNYLDDYAYESNRSKSIIPNGGSNVDFSLQFIPSNSSCYGYLNYLEVNVRRNLVFGINNGVDQLQFRDLNSVGAGNVAQFSITNANSSTKIWNVTDPTTVFVQLNNGTSGVFNAQTDMLNQYVAFGGNSFLSPVYSEKVVNQNLHATAQVDYIIVAHPLFVDEANRLADFHRTKSNLSTVVIPTNQIYNEFSSGAQDISGIRDFVKMFYDRASTSGTYPQHLLLFGDGSYNNKSANGTNGNFIPTYQSINSVSYINSYVTDDFFGLLDDNEGLCGNSEKIDVGVGRFNCRNKEEAKLMVDKTIRYGSESLNNTGNCNSNTSGVFGDWRNTLTFIADDEDGNLHLRQADSLGSFIFNNARQFNVDKIYLDAYEQVATPAGQAFPGATEAINRRMEKGSLLINYTGHGGEVGWAQEGVIDNSVILGWKNSTRLPVFVTATCEFSRWDDPARVSAGENVFLNPDGGSVALFSTTRLVYASFNEDLNNSIIRVMFTKVNGEYPLLGDIYRLSKIEPINLNQNTRNFSLLGDPALKMAYPKYKIEPTEINGVPIIAYADTIGALQKVTMKGIITDGNGQKLTSFNGYIYPSVFDKPNSVQTLNNDAGSPRTNFVLQKNILHKGKASVTNGDWEFTFIVPKDIAYQYGVGKFSFYAENGIADASGYNDSIVIGGSSSNNFSDNDGPQIKLYMNDEKFVTGGLTNENPKIYAVVFDSTGINTVGNGIGHDITASIDGKIDPVYVLNDYYESDLNQYQSGKIVYPLQNLSEGRHTLKIKVWDILNNSNEANTEFIVAESAELALKHVFNYPNPFTTNTAFYFEHNMPCEPLNVQVAIYTVTGKLVKTISKSTTCEGFRSDNISWDGKDDFGDRIGKGVYVYRLKVNTTDGLTASKTEKLVLLK